MPIVGTTTTYVAETVRTDDGYIAFIQMIDEAGGHRFVLPNKVVQALYRHYESIVKQAKSERSKRAAQHRKAQGIVPFQKKAVNA